MYIPQKKPRVFDLTKEADDVFRIPIDQNLRIRELRLLSRFLAPIETGGIRRLLLRVQPRWLPKLGEPFFFSIKTENNEYTLWKRGWCIEDPTPVIITYAKQLPVLFYAPDAEKSTCEFQLVAMTPEADLFARERGFQDFGYCSRFFRTGRDKETQQTLDLTETLIYDFNFELESDIDVFQPPFFN